MTTGVISGLGRGITAGSPFEGFVEKLDNVIQTDAAINPGNSGGPLLNSSGQVIGINTAVASSAQNIGFAIPADVIKSSLDNFNKGGQFERAFLGVSYRMLDPRIASLNDLPAGAYVESVVNDSPAQKVGIQGQDIITHYNNKRLEKDKFELSGAISQNKIGEAVTLKIWRDGKTMDIKVTLGPSPSQ
ncbi:MAG: PDZ domain-containing protein [Candidatus Levybacteria bacterium]|nr:PDZ domain-containing protein [Candidatus Levybacteria bacterium]